MEQINIFFDNHLWAAFIILLLSFVVLAKSADIFVDSSVVIAYHLKIPKLVIGLVLVSLATTAPELAVSSISAIKGHPEIALGNAIGSVICDDGIALALAGLFAASPIMVLPTVMKSSGLFLLVVMFLISIFIFIDNSLSAYEGIILLILFIGYIYYLYVAHKNGKLKNDFEAPEENKSELCNYWKVISKFILSLFLLVIFSDLLISSTTSIARAMNIPEVIIALTLIAFGTSVPEIASCISAAKKGHGDLAVGNIIGADIFNICWVAGISSMFNTLTLTPKQVYFALPAMLVIASAMLIMLRWKYNLNKTKSIVLLLIYLIYLTVSFYFY